MMKVVIWDGYGGFRLSQEALEYLIDKKGWSVGRTLPVESRRYSDNIPSGYFFDVPINKYVVDILDLSDTEAYNESIVDYNKLIAKECPNASKEEIEEKYPIKQYVHKYDINYYKWDEDEKEFRTHPDVIETIEVLGNRSDTECRGLIKIIELPGDLAWDNWYIFEHEGGSEAIHEKHRIWG